jgi:hypothetical protein
MRKPQTQEKLIPLMDISTWGESAMCTEFSEGWQPQAQLGDGSLLFI